MGDIRVRRRRRVDAPPGQLWRLIDDPAELSKWFSLAERIEIVEGAGLGRTTTSPPTITLAIAVGCIE